MSRAVRTLVGEDILVLLGFVDGGSGEGGFGGHGVVVVMWGLEEDVVGLEGRCVVDDVGEEDQDLGWWFKGSEILDLIFTRRL